MDAGIVIALIGALGTVLGSLILWLRKTQSSLFQRISELEEAVETCHRERIVDSIKIGKLTETVLQLQHMLSAELPAGAPLRCRFRVDINGKILDVQPTCEALLGFTVFDLVGKSIHMLIPEDLQGPHQRAFTQRALDSDIRRDSVILRNMAANHKIGGVTPVRIALSEITGADGRKEFIANFQHIGDL